MVVPLSAWKLTLSEQLEILEILESSLHCGDVIDVGHTDWKVHWHGGDVVDVGHTGKCNHIIGDVRHIGDVRSCDCSIVEL